jgi:hypothetical protein
MDPVMQANRWAIGRPLERKTNLRTPLQGEPSKRASEGNHYVNTSVIRFSSQSLFRCPQGAIQSTTSLDVGYQCIAEK